MSRAHHPSGSSGSSGASDLGDPSAVNQASGSSLLIRSAAAILTGRAGAAARHAGPDIRVRDGRIEALGALTPGPGEAQIDAQDCVAYPA